MPDDSVPSVLVQLSDPHLVAGDPSREAALAAAVERVNGLGIEPLAVLLTGDVAHHGAPEEYATALAVLDGLSAPVHVIPGNKDDRAELRAAFGLPGSGAEPVQYVAEAGPLRLVMANSTIPGEVPGRLDAAWIADQLEAAPEHPTVLALHHPGFEVGVPALDGVGLSAADRTALAALLERSPQVLRVVSGHVHRASFGVVGGRPAATAPSVSVPFAFDLAADSPSPVDEPPGFLVHALVGGRIVTHVLPL